MGIKTLFEIIISAVVFVIILLKYKDYQKKGKELLNLEDSISTKDLSIDEIFYYYAVVNFQVSNYTMCKICKKVTGEVVIYMRFNYPASYQNFILLVDKLNDRKIYNYKIRSFNLKENELNISIRNFFYTGYKLNILIKDQEDLQALKKIFE